MVRPDFKPGWGRQPFPGWFDSICFPPVDIYSKRVIHSWSSQFFAAPYLWDDAIHATGVKKYLWITGGLIGISCTAIFLAWAIRLNKSQKKIESKPESDPLIPVGPELAKAVADRLDAGNDLAYGHPCYCGMGLAKYGNAYVYASVNDGEVVTPKDGEDLPGLHFPEFIMAFRFA